MGKKEYMKEYYQKNREKFLRYAKEKYDKDTKRTYNQKYYVNNKDKLKELMKQYYYNNKEKWDKYNNYNSPIGRASSLLKSYNASDVEHDRGLGNLTPEWIVENIFSKPCAHCGKEGWKIIGCNRIDNSKPHSKDNVEPCCKECNNKLPRKLPLNQLGEIKFV